MFTAESAASAAKNAARGSSSRAIADDAFEELRALEVTPLNVDPRDRADVDEFILDKLSATLQRDTEPHEEIPEEEVAHSKKARELPLVPSSRRDLSLSVRQRSSALAAEFHPTKNVPLTADSSVLLTQVSRQLFPVDRDSAEMASASLQPTSASL